MWMKLAMEGIKSAPKKLPGADGLRYIGTRIFPSAFEVDAMVYSFSNEKVAFKQLLITKMDRLVEKINLLDFNQNPNILRLALIQQ